MSTATATATPADLVAPRPAVNKWLVTLSISFGTLMGAIDASIVNVALPHIRGAVGATVQEITWISTAYAIAVVLVMPLTGFLGRLFGQKNVYLFCLVLFLIGSLLCGVATSLPALVFFRVLQGLGAGALQPTEQAILRQTFPPKEQGMAMALFGMAVMLGPAIGPTLGGYIVDHWHWSWIFFINLPIGLVGLFMVVSFVHEDPEIRSANLKMAAAQRRNVDWWGIGLLSVSMSSLVYFLEEGSAHDWFESKLIIACCLVAVFSLAAFIIRELTAPAPAVNLALFKDRAFLSGTVIGGLMFAMLMANMFLLPIFMQELLGFTATQSGLALMPRVLVMMVAVPIVGRIHNRLSPRILIAAGVLLVSYGSWLMSHLSLQSGAGHVVGALAFQGMGFACLFVPLTTVALSSIPKHLMPDATGLNSLVRQLGGAIGLAIFGSLIGHNATIARASLYAHVTETNPIAQERLLMVQQGLMAKGFDAASAQQGALANLYGAAYRQSMVLSFDKLFLLAGILFLMVLPLLVFLKYKRGGPAAEIHIEA
ncbi:DHA2 family efflux MFS transporter permease subunit [Hyalangium minutum]|uniref:Inner membrane component of tripartite multidrug resistance system n=1 Tax=Hyalangium minutum TaxID=394096 RepID=A0A085WRY9_9BACT|nr:DHA2 family efflux MFS transporter permease subunit [Hyalangium minutum]KFE70452.1 Inner membrane component of tripartite multidrug resistance system [Hyalangium minutum]